MITFADAEVAQRCIEMYNGQPFPGAERPMSLSIARFKSQDTPGGRGGGRGGRGGFGSDRGGFRGGSDRGALRGGRGGGNQEQRANDWTCSGCNNNNFAFRQVTMINNFSYIMFSNVISVEQREVAARVEQCDMVEADRQAAIVTDRINRMKHPVSLIYFFYSIGICNLFLRNISYYWRLFTIQRLPCFLSDFPIIKNLFCP